MSSLHLSKLSLTSPFNAAVTDDVCYRWLIKASWLRWKFFHYSQKKWQMCLSVWMWESDGSLLHIKPLGGREREGEIRKYRRHQAIWSITGHVLVRERETLRNPNRCSLTVTHAHTSWVCGRWITDWYTVLTYLQIVAPSFKCYAKTLKNCDTEPHPHKYTHTQNVRLRMETISFNSSQFVNDFQY